MTLCKEECHIRNHIFPLLLVVASIVVCVSPTPAQTPEPVKFVTAKPAYAKVALTADEQKVLLLALDESGGTGTGYDTVYADTNFNDVIEAAEKLKPLGDATASYVTYAPLAFAFGYNDLGKGLEKPLALALTRVASGDGGGRFSVSLTARLKQGDATWEYTFRGALQPTADRQQVVAATTQPLTTEITTRPGNGLGIAVRLSAADFTLSCHSPQGNPRVRLVVKNQAGKTVSDTTVPLDRLGYG
jgi:hypothetical protein